MVSGDSDAAGGAALRVIPFPGRARRRPPRPGMVPVPVRPGCRATVPLMTSVAACGFPSPAEDHMERPLDFNDLLVTHPSSTFAVRVAGDSMVGIGMYPGDVAVVDRSLEPVPGRVVLALLDGEFTIKTLRRNGGAVVLEAANPAFRPIRVAEGSDFEVWGVVTHCIRMLLA